MLYFFLLVFSLIKFARFSRNLSVSCSWFKLSILQKICSIFFFRLHCFPSHACMPTQFSCVWLFVTLWTVAYQAPLSMGFSRQEYWSGLPCPSPGDLPNPGIEPTSLNSPALAGRFFTTRTTWEDLSFSLAFLNFFFSEFPCWMSCSCLSVLFF